MFRDAPQGPPRGASVRGRAPESPPCRGLEQNIFVHTLRQLLAGELIEICWHFYRNLSIDKFLINMYRQLVRVTAAAPG
jgi:hypothetical protein